VLDRRCYSVRGREGPLVKTRLKRVVISCRQPLLFISVPPGGGVKKLRPGVSVDILLGQEKKRVKRLGNFDHCLGV
jgi:hypothetical protein